MARYAVEADFLDNMPNYIKLALFDDNHDGVVDVGLPELVLEAACDDVDLELSAFYTVPLTGTIPGSIKLLTLDIAKYRAHDRIGKATDRMDENYKLALEKLRRIGENKTGTGLEPRPVERPGVTVAKLSSAPRVFSTSSMSVLP